MSLSELGPYFDTMASTPMDPRVLEVMLPLLQDPRLCANPSAVTHAHGQHVGRLVKEATDQAGKALDAGPDSLIWTSGASESIQLALVGAAHAYQRQGKHIISMSTEHKATLAVLGRLEKEGFEITLLDPEPSGVLALNTLKQAIRTDTIVVSIMHVNNETGVIQPIKAIAKLCHEKGALLHVDAAQSLGKLSFSLVDLEADLVSLSMHKCYGPKGIGVLYQRQKPFVQLEPQILGGNQQRFRAGTLATPMILAASQAICLAQSEQAKDAKHADICMAIIREGLSALAGIHVNATETVPHCLSVYVEGVDISSVLAMCFDVALATGSACNATTKLPSHVLMAMGFDAHRAHHSLRISVGRLTTQEECHALLESLTKTLIQLRAWSPSWEGLP